MQLAYNSKLKPHRKNLSQGPRGVLGLVVAASIIFYLLYKTTSSYTLSLDKHQYPKYHGLYKNDLFTKSPLIFPSVEHAPLLRELTIDGLFNTQIDSQGNKKYLFTDAFDDDHDDVDNNNNNKLESEENTNQMLKVKNSFLNHGKLRFKNPNGGNDPEIVLVTGIDFEKYELSHLTKIVQNRVNYAQKKKYGLYVSWLQNFTPIIKETQSSKDWVKIFLLRSAMYSFPNAKFFWYLDQDALIMRYDIDLFKYLLDPKVLDPIMLRDHPIIPPNGVIHTFKNSKSSNIELILTQDGVDLNLNSFIIKNQFLAKSLIEFWCDKLFRLYHNFPKNAESALTHILQWHPIYLSRTAIIPPRTIAGLHTALELSDDGDDIHYSPGDFVVSLRDCQARKSCEQEIDLYWSKLEGEK